MGHNPAVATFLARGADPNARDDGCWTSLTWAAYAGSADVVDRLLRAGADLGWTPVAWAGHANHPHVAERMETAARQTAA